MIPSSMMIDIQKLENERDNARLGLGPVLYHIRTLDEVRSAAMKYTFIGIFKQIYDNPETMQQIAWMMLPKSEGGDGPEYLEPRV